jgi:phosphatidylglycerophosphatase C
MPRGAAVFDFDRTLVRQETMAMFLRLVVGRTAYASACCVSGAKASVAAPATRMDVFRAELLRRTLAGRTVGQAMQAAERLYPRLGWITSIVEKLSQHRDAGRKVLVATGSLSIYMPTLLSEKRVDPDGLLATEMVVDGDTLTGEMATPSCTWSEKARRVKNWLAEVEGPVWGYGNLPHDGAMLALTNHPTAVPT